MNQIPLPLLERISYSAQNFVPHRGVREVFDECLRAPHDAFFLRFIVAPHRFGKTHFAIALCEEMVKQGLHPVLLDGAGFDQQLKISASDLKSADALPIYIVDDADQALCNILPGGSGPFVDFIEQLRQMQGRVYFLSQLTVESLPCDDHVLSRLRAGRGLSIGAPGDEDLPALLTTITRQHGIALTHRSMSFLLRRLHRNIPALEYYLDRLLHLSQVLGRSIKFSTLSAALPLDS